MKKCFNCNGTNRNTDIYCRNCGLILKKSTHYVLINLGTIVAVAGLMFVIVLLILSYVID